MSAAWVDWKLSWIIIFVPGKTLLHITVFEFLHSRWVPLLFKVDLFVLFLWWFKFLKEVWLTLLFLRLVDFCSIFKKFSTCFCQMFRSRRTQVILRYAIIALDLLIVKDISLHLNLALDWVVCFEIIWIGIFFFIAIAKSSEATMDDWSNWCHLLDLRRLFDVKHRALFCSFYLARSVIKLWSVSFNGLFQFRKEHIFILVLWYHLLRVVSMYLALLLLFLLLSHKLMRLIAIRWFRIIAIDRLKISIYCR